MTYPFPIILERVTKSSNNFAISSGGIGEALQRSASSMAAAGNTLDETIALTTSANEVVQNPEKVGNALKTISMRIRSAKSEMEEMGEDTTGMVESTAKLREEIMALSGVDIMQDANTFKSTYAIMDELAQKWEGLTDIQQASIIELMAGKHQGNVFASLMQNFQTARDALDTSLNSSGSAMEEHAKWSESLEARLLKLKATWQSLSQSFMDSSLLKGGLDLITGFVDVVDKLVSTLGTIPTILAGFAVFKGVFALLTTFKTMNLVGGLASIGSVVSVLVEAFPALAAGVSAFTATLAGSATIFGVVKAAAVGLWTVLAAHPILATVAAVGLAIAAYDKLTESASELADRIEEVTSNYREQRKELSKLKGDYDTTNEDSMISKYGELSKGVDSLGENISLTADEYAEYQSIVNEMVSANPELIAGYNSQGEAVLKYAGDVDALAQSYRDLIKEQDKEVLETGKDIFKDFENDINSKEMFKGDVTGNIEAFENLLSAKNAGNIESAVESLSGVQAMQISRMLEEYGIARDVLGSGEKGYEDYRQHIIRAAKENIAEVKGVLNEASADLNAYAEDLGTVTEAYFSTAFLGGNQELKYKIDDYSHLSEKMQNVISQAMSGLDADFYAPFLESDDPYKALTDYYNSVLSAFDSMSDKEASEFDAVFDLKTQFNGGDISYGDYVNGLVNAGELIDGIQGLQPEIASQIKLNLGLNEDGLVSQYENLLNRLTETNKNEIATGNIIGLSDNEAKNLLNSLSAKELSVMTRILPDIDANATIAEIQAAIDREMAISGLIFDLNIEVEAAGIESLNTAMQESVTASGLSSESISALESRYSELEAQGWDLSTMFEETAHGIHLNKNELSKFENELSKQKFEKVNNDLQKMKSVYDELGEAIKNCDDPIKKSELFNKRQNLAQQISDAAMAASQLQGLTSAYNDWVTAEEAGNERDMYENVISGFETVKDELSRGWADDSTIEFLELVTGRTDLAGKSGKELKGIYDGLGKSIKYLNEEGKVLEDTGYSVRDFFTVDDEGNSTSKGVYNFLDAIGKLEEEAFLDKNGNPIDVIKRDPKTQKITGFDFSLVAEKDENGNIIKNGDQVIAEALGISEELVQIMIRAADDAGFVVSMDGTYKQFADMENEARDSVNVINELFDEEYSFNFNTSDLTSLTNDLEEAKKLLDKTDENGKKLFWNDDGTFNFDAEGATEAMQIASTLQAKIDMLSQEKYGIGLTVENKEFEKPLENLQEYGRTIAALNQLNLNPEANAEDIAVLETRLDELAQEFNNLPDEKKIELGLTGETDKIALTQEYLNGLPDEKKIELGYVDENGKPLTNINDVIQSKIEAGEVKIPAVLDIQANMDKNISELKDIALLTSGLLSQEQEEAIKIRLGIEVEGDVNADGVQEDIDNAVETVANGALHGAIGNVNISANNVDAEGVEEEVKDSVNGAVKGAIESVENSGTNTADLDITANASVNTNVSADTNANNITQVAEASNALEGVESKYVSIGADINGNVINLTEDKINNLTLFAAAAKTLQDVEGKSVWIDATINGNVLDFDAEKVGNLQTFATGVNALQDVKGKSVWIDATINGNVLDFDAEKVGNLQTFATGVNALQDVKGKSVWVDANINGNVVDLETDKISKVETFAIGAKALQDVESKTVSVTANIDGSVLDADSENIAKLKKFADNAKELDGVTDKTVTITANFEGTLKESDNIENLAIFAESAKKLEGVGDSDVIVTASVYGNLNTWTGNFDDLTNFSNVANALQSADSKDVSITANIEGNLSNDSVSRLEKFASVVNTTANKSVDIGVKASVDVDSVNAAMDLLREVSTSGLFKDYSASVTATVNYTKGEQIDPEDKTSNVNYNLGTQVSPEDKTATVNYALGTQEDPESKTVYVNYVDSGNGTGGAAGTAHVSGSASGRAFARGNWGVQGDGVALGGELGRRYCDHT